MAETLYRRQLPRIMGGEVCPPEWISKGEENPIDQINKALAQWNENVEKFQKTFQTEVYDNPNADQWQFRQHRLHLCRLMMLGEGLAIDALNCVEDLKIRSPLIDLIDGKIAPLRKIFFRWHGPIEGQTDLPDALKSAMLQCAANDTEPMGSLLE
jgi:hypothetical protein